MDLVRGRRQGNLPGEGGLAIVGVVSEMSSSLIVGFAGEEVKRGLFLKSSMQRRYKSKRCACRTRRRCWVQVSVFQSSWNSSPSVNE